VTYCYELIEYIRKSAPKETTDEGVTPEDAVWAFVDIMLHEISHAIFDMLKIPVFGREEDRPNQLGGVHPAAIRQGRGGRTLTGTAHSGAACRSPEAPNTPTSRRPWRAAQRFYNVHASPMARA